MIKNKPNNVGQIAPERQAAQFNSEGALDQFKEGVGPVPSGVRDGNITPNRLSVSCESSSYYRFCYSNRLKFWIREIQVTQKFKFEKKIEKWNRNTVPGEGSSKNFCIKRHTCKIIASKFVREQLIITKV